MNIYNKLNDRNRLLSQVSIPGKNDFLRVNAHLHTPYSFSAFESVQQALDMAVAENVRDYCMSQVPLGKGCSPADVVKAIFYAIDQENETGQAIPVTGGQTMLN